MGQQVAGLGHQAQRMEPVRQRADHRVEQPGPVEAGEEARHGPGQEDQRLDDSPAREGLVEEESEDQAEDELQDDGCAGPEQRVAERAVEGGVARKLPELVETDEAAREGVEQDHIAESVGNAYGQWHQHHGRDEDQRRRAVEPRRRGVGQALQPRLLEVPAVQGLGGKGHKSIVSCWMVCGGIHPSPTSAKGSLTFTRPAYPLPQGER